jgi:hypothetical protein
VTAMLANHVSEVVDARKVRPEGSAPVMVRLVGGTGNQVSGNHIVGKDVRAASGGSAFEAQVDALLSTTTSARLAVVAVLVDAASTGNTILDSGTEDEVVADRSVNAVRATPSIPG